MFIVKINIKQSTQTPVQYIQFTAIPAKINTGGKTPPMFIPIHTNFDYREDYQLIKTYFVQFLEQ